MSDSPPPITPQELTPQTPTGVLSSPATPPARNLPVAAWSVAGLIVVAILAGLIIAGRRHPEPSSNAVLPLDPYAASLPITGIVMSESTSLSGGKSTFIDGRLQNTGPRTVTGAIVQVFFRNDEGLPPRIESLPISLVRTREPYVDTQPVSAAPLPPGDTREFRLIFEAIPGNWNLQVPEIHVVRVTTR